MIKALHTVCLLVVIGCSSATTEPLNCLQGLACAEGEVCVEGTCRIVDCTDSADCAFGEYCDLDTFACLDGCLEESDCLATETCSQNECTERVCENTQTDCPLGQFCDSDDGTCFEDGYWCDACTTDAQCPSDARCVVFDDTYSWCVRTCDSDVDCPAGFVCIEDGIQLPSGAFVNYCYAACDLLTESGLY